MFFFLVESWAIDIQGMMLNDSWFFSENTVSNPFDKDIQWVEKEIPFHGSTSESVFINCKYYFNGRYKYLVLPFISSSGFRLYLNGVMINQIGDMENGSANVWNHVHIVRLDDNLLRDKENELIVEINSMYTYGIDKAPLLTNSSLAYSKIYIQNIFRTYLPFISMGAALILGIILIILGISDKKMRTLFFHIGTCMFLTAIFLFDDRFRISTGSVEFFLILRKITVSSGFLASWFLASSMEIYTTGKLKVSRLLLIVNLFVLFFAIIQPTFYDFANWINHTLILNIINIFTASVILITHLKKREWLFLPIFFMNLTFIHYIITWHIMRSLGPNLTNLGLIFGSIGFGLILIVQFRSLLQKNMEMSKKNYELEIQKNEALKSAQMKSDIIAQTSHEIRNPLMGILGMSEFLLSKQFDEETLDDISVIKSCSLNLKEILNNILDNAKIEAGKFERRDELFSIDDIMHELNSIYSILSKQKDLDWKIYKEKDVPDYIVSDKLRITQILNNLLSNAVKYTNSGEVTLCIAVLDNNLVFTVSDTGSGIKKELQDKIFDPYYQLETSIHIQGTGLGLSIVKKLIKILDGKIFLTSEVDRGSEFKVFIPFKKVESVKNKQSIVRGKNLSVLLADDNQINVKVLKNYLKERNDLKISTAVNGKETMDKLNDELFDVVIMDINMPFLNGDEIIERIKKSDSINRNTTFIALTGENNGKKSHHYKNIGFSEILKKPVSKNTFLALFESGNISTTFEEDEQSEVFNRIRSAELDDKTIFLIIFEFLKETPDVMESLKQAISKLDFQTIYIKAHYLKSSLDYLGNERASDLRVLIETAAKEEDIGSIKMYHDEFFLELRKLLEFYQKAVEDKESFLKLYKSK